MVQPVTARHDPGPPAALTGEVSRVRLLSVLAGRFERPVTTVVAGAGFGKTTLLAQAMRQNLAAPVGIDAWVSCQPDDEDPVQFTAACCRAIGADQTISRGRGSDVIAAMRQVSPIDVCLLIDDIHQLAGPASQALLAEVARHLPSNGHLVLSGRTEAGIPLARLRVTGDCVAISERELAFTPAEERSLARLLDVQPPRRELAGWPALVRLALTSQRTLAQQFLWEEIVGGLRPVEARALLTLALIGWGDSRNVSQVCGEHVEVQKLAAKIPMLTVSDHGVARAHDLWTDSVERLYTPEQIAALLPAVRDALRARHDALRLVTVAELLRDSETIRMAALDLVKQTMASLPVQQARMLLAAADPADLEAPELLLLRSAVAHAVAVDDPTTEPLVAKATKAFAAASDETGEIAALTLAGTIASARGAYADFLQIAIRVAELPAAREDQVLQVVSALVTATLADLNGDLDTALEALARLPSPASNHPMREPAARLHVYMLVLAGRADEAAVIADGVLRASNHAHIRKTPPFVRWSAGDVSEIEELRADDGPADDTNARDRFFYATLSMYVRASAGDIRRLRELADLLETVPVNRADARDASMLAAAMATRLIAEHDEDGARRELTDHLRRYPVDDPRCDVQLRRALAAVYVCVPEIRPNWDSARLGRCHRRMRLVARAVLAVREAGSCRPPDTIGAAITAALDETDALITMLPLPLSVELAVRAHGLGLAAGLRATEVLRRRIGENVLTELVWQREHGDDLVRRAAAELLTAADAPPSQRVRIEVVGPARVYIDGQPVDNAASRRIRVRQLLSLLVVEPHLRRDRAMTLLWPDLDQTSASRNLRVTLTYLRQVLRGSGDAEPAAGHPPDERFLVVDSSSVRLVAHPGLDVDLWQLDAHLAAAAQAWAAGDQRAHASALAAAAELWRGEPLVDLEDVDELSGEVTRVRTALVDSTLTLGEIRLSEGRPADSVRSAHAALAADAYNERAHRLAIATQIQLGDHAAASAAARRMMRALSEVGAVPADTTKILLRRIAMVSNAR
ncbi:MAG: BTAD domain-containing putative transcriptional regulator [Streptosporangiaceae bacterium]